MAIEGGAARGLVACQLLGMGMGQPLACNTCGQQQGGCRAEAERQLRGLRRRACAGRVQGDRWLGGYKRVWSFPTPQAFHAHDAAMRGNAVGAAHHKPGYLSCCPSHAYPCKQPPSPSNQAQSVALGAACLTPHAPRLASSAMARLHTHCLACPCPSHVVTHVTCPCRCASR